MISSVVNNGWNSQQYGKNAGLSIWACTANELAEVLPQKQVQELAQRLAEEIAKELALELAQELAQKLAEVLT
jgi:hypothetical protein